MLAALDDGRLEGWPENVRVMQRNWIGKSKGLQMTFPLVGPPSAPDGHTGIEVYTTRPDTLYGASFIALSPDHPVTEKIAKTDPALQRSLNRRNVALLKSGRNNQSNYC